jgi:hypothetical protein
MLELGLDGLLDFVGEFSALRVEELDAVVVVEIVRRADDDAEVAFELAREVGDPGVGSGPMRLTFTPAATKPPSSAASNM